ncbi:flavin reductase family protein [Ruania rhizosphaerae]|uniref:flavin reductase family protein n=1 Tax=Ruania rhizosphaerae TaxID=1840413 RepID=UPI0013590B55|nr:flavin reductase family protein [Ruania rhizosphaerae]
MTVTARPAHHVDSDEAQERSAQFRRAMSTLPAGVCVITTADSDGTPSGLTVSTGFSISVTPPMFGLCVDLRARTLPVLLQRGAFVANILHGDAEEAATIFASRATDKFGRTGYTRTDTGLPWLDRHAAHAVECSILSTTEAGDHLLIVGAVGAVHASPGSAGTPGAVQSMLAYGDRAFHRLPRLP